MTPPCLPQGEEFIIAIEEQIVYLISKCLTTKSKISSRTCDNSEKSLSFVNRITWKPFCSKFSVLIRSLICCWAYAHIQHLLQTKPGLRLDILNHSLVYFMFFQNWLEKSHSWEADYCDVSFYKDLLMDHCIFLGDNVAHWKEHKLLSER